ncbi:MAG: hypothetical protein ACI9JN_000193 [Bacteroidia bacterium]|jgi:hypothetical protein
MELIDLVSELLYNKNCVIIPGFGGFVGNFKSTDFDANRSLISPTRKKVAFNESLIENDGLLINALQKKKDISYEQAEKEVGLFTSFLKGRLAKYKNYEFKNLGSLYLNKEDNLIFVAYDGANFHKKSYGLSEVKIKRLRNIVQTEQPVVKKLTQESKVIPMPKTTAKRTFYIPQIAASVAILSLFGVMLWQLLQTSAEKPLATSDIETTDDEDITASIIPDIDLGDTEALDVTMVPNETVESVENTMEYTDVTDEVILTATEPNMTEVQVIVPEETVIEEPEVKQPIETEEITAPVEAVKMVKPYNPFSETVYYIAVAKNFTSATESVKRKKLEKKEYDLFEVQSGADKVLCIEKFISHKNAKDFLKLVNRYDDREAFIFENQE